MSERQYSDDQAAAIFEQASKTEHPALPAPAGSLGNPGSITGVGLMAAIGLGMFGIGALRLPGWAGRRRPRIDRVLARLPGSRA